MPTDKTFINNLAYVFPDAINIIFHVICNLIYFLA